MNTPSWRPKCPVCGSVLEGIPFPMPSKGVGRCPAAGNYEYEADTNNERVGKDKNGNVTKKLDWKVDGDMTNH